MCKEKCEFDDKRLIGANGLYCISKLKRSSTFEWIFKEKKSWFGAKDEDQN